MNKKFCLFLYLLIFLSALSGQSLEKMHLRSASEPDYPPFCIVNDDGTVDGFSVELLRAACEAMDIEITFKVDEWSIIRQELADGKLDVLPLVGRTPERESLYDFTFPYMTYHGAVFARTGDDRFKTREDLKNAKLMVMKGDNAEEFARRVKLTSDIETVESFETAFRNLSEGKSDFVVTQKVMGLNLIKQTGITNIVPLDIDIKDFQQNFCFAVEKGNTSLLSILNEGLSIVIADGTFNRLHRKWFEPRSEIGKNKLVIGGDVVFPPFTFLDSKGNPTGQNVDVSHAIAKDMGMKLDLKLGKWSEIQENFKNGEYDAVQNILYSDKRAEYLDFSIPFAVSSYRIFARKGTPIPDTIEELKGKKIIVEKSDVMQDILEKAGLGEYLLFANSHEDALKKLAGGDGDYAPLSYLTAIFFIKQNKIENLHYGKSSIINAEFCYAVRKGDIMLLNNINNSLANIKASGEYRDIYIKWFGEEEFEIDYTNFIKYAVGLLILFLILFSGFVIWNRQLKKQVWKKTSELIERESLLYGIFDNMPSGSAVYQVAGSGDSGSDFIIKYFNKKSLDIENKKPEEVIGKTLKDLRPNIDKYGLIPVLQQVWKTGKPEYFPAKIYEDDRYSNYYENVVFKLPSGEIVTIYDDVTEKMNALLQVAESEEKYRQVFESASEGIFMTRPDGSILSANPEACRLLGRTEKEIIELGRDKLFDTTDPKYTKALEVRRKKGSFKGEITAVGKDGTRIPVMLTSNIYKDQKGEEKSITIFSDISERKQDENRVQAYLAELEKNKNAMINILKDVNLEVAERRKAQEDLKKLNSELEEKVKERTAKLEKQNRELASAQESLIMVLEDVNDTRDRLAKANYLLTAANKELEAFSYSVSHDLRAPLRAILGFSNILKQDYRKDLDEEGDRYLNKIVDNTSKMHKLIDDLLEFSRVGRSSIKLVRIKTADLLKKIFEEATDGETDRKFDFAIAENIPDIQADRMLATQLFHNIIGNAVKFTSKKDIAVIRINYENDGKFHIISVKDNGAGFDEKYKHKIFEVFQRLHGTEEFPGTGVGMSIVAKVAAKHGWFLDAESKNGEGAIFYIKIPLEDKKEVGNEERV